MCGGGMGQRAGLGQGLCRHDSGDRISRPQNDPAAVHPRLDPARDLALGDTGQHLGVRRGRRCAKVAVFAGKVAEILGDRLHRAEGVVEPFQGA